MPATTPGRWTCPGLDHDGRAGILAKIVRHLRQGPIHFHRLDLCGGNPRQHLRDHRAGPLPGCSGRRPLPHTVDEHCDVVRRVAALREDDAPALHLDSRHLRKQLDGVEGAGALDLRASNERAGTRLLPADELRIPGLGRRGVSSHDTTRWRGLEGGNPVRPRNQGDHRIADAAGPKLDDGGRPEIAGLSGFQRHDGVGQAAQAEPSLAVGRSPGSGFHNANFHARDAVAEPVANQAIHLAALCGKILRGERNQRGKEGKSNCPGCEHLAHPAKGSQDMTRE
jgi:hypothetical protein